MKKRFLLSCTVVVILFVCSFWFFTPISLENKSDKCLVDFSADNPSKLLEEAVGRLSLLSRWYSLDFMSIEYATTDYGYKVNSVKFGFSHYHGFDVYGASCINYDGSSVESEYMQEEAKTIYDNLYETMAYVGCGTGVLSRYLGSIELPFSTIIGNAISVEGQNPDSSITTKLDEQSGIITFFEK